MDGIISYLLSKKYTNDTVIGMGAIKGAPCQVQSVDKVNKTTTITLKWEDNDGGVHTEAFDIEDGADGVSVTNATINANGNLIITLSNGNDIDCGKVLPQYNTLPSPTSSNVGQILQYIGTTNANYTHGYFYECVLDDGVYKWQYVNVQDSYTKAQIGSLSDLPDTTKNVVLNIADLSSAIDEKEDIFRYSSLPTASATNVGDIIQYIGTTTADYTNGYYYQCREVSTGVYEWVQKNIQPNSGSGGGDGTVDGYYNETDHLFYEENTYINPISGESNTLYVSLDTNLLYRYDSDNSIFIRVDEHSDGQTIQVSTMPTASASELGNIYQFVGTTTLDYTNGYFYKCVENDNVYSWERINTQDSYTKSEIGNLNSLPDNTKNVVENINDLDTNKEDIFRYAHGVDIPTASASNVGTIIQYIGTTTSDYVSGFFYQCQLDSDTSTYKWVNIEVQPASGTSAVESVNGKTGVVVLDAKDIGLQVETMPTANVDNLGRIVQYVGTTSVDYTNGYFYRCVTDGTNYSWELVADFALASDVYTKTQVGALTDLPDTSKNIVQNIDAINTTVGGKTDKVSSATNGDLAGLNASGELTDSGILASNVVVKSNTAGLIKNDGTIDTSTYATTTQLADKADKVTSAVVDDFATLDSNGNLTDSGINKNIVPSSATSSNKLATINDIPDDINDLDDVVITSPTNAQILAYNSTSGKWENQTGQAAIGGAVFKGSINFANLPTTGMVNGDWYDIKDAFTTDSRFEEGSGIACAAGTDVIWVDTDSKWNILTPSGVYSFNGRVGAVTPASGDYDASDIDYDNTTSGLTADDIQEAIDEIDGTIDGILDGSTIDSFGDVESALTDKADKSSAYLTTDTAETDLDDADYVPFYDTSVTAKKKSLWSNIKAKLKTYFDTLYASLSSVTAIEGKIPSGASSSNKLATASDVAGRVDWESYAKTGVHNLAKSYKAETYTEQYYRALNIDINLQPSTTYNFILDLPNSGNEYYFNDSLFVGGDTITADGTKKVVTRATKSTIDNSQYNLANGGWYILKNATVQSSAPAFTDIAVCYGADTSDEITPYAMTNEELTNSKVDWSSYAKTGAYNSLNIDSYSLTANGTTVTNITGGKNIKVSNTAWQYAGADFIIANPYKGEHQIFDCDVDYVAGTVGVVIMTNSSASASGATMIATSGYFTEDKHVTLEFDGGSANYFIIRFILNGSEAGAGEINVTNLMISPKGGAYVPHAMTNEQLTEAVATIPIVSVSHTGTASSTGVRKEVISVNNVEYEVDGSAYMEQSVTLSTSQATTVTFTNAIIADGKMITMASSLWDLVPDDIVTTTGVCTITLPKWSSAETIGVRLYVR